MLQKVPVFQGYAKQVFRYIAEVTRVEEVVANQEIQNGNTKNDFDFLYIAKGAIDFHMRENVKKVEGAGNKLSVPYTSAKDVYKNLKQM